MPALIRLACAHLLVAACVMTAVARQPVGRSLPEQFQEAVTLMEARGNCRAALPLFGRVAEGSDRALAARALVYVGVCQERLGRDDAARSYRRVIEQYADQSAAVREASRRLNALSQHGSPAAPATRTFREIQHSIPDMHRAGATSVDGRTFAYVNRAGQVALADLAIATKLRIVADAAGGVVGQRPAPSPDSRRVAYLWQPDSGGAVELRVASSPKVPPRLLLRANEGESLHIHDWQLAGHLLIERVSSAGHAALWTIRVSDGHASHVTSLPHPLTGAKHSPDGRFVAYDVWAADRTSRDVVVRAIGGGAETLRVAGNSNDAWPCWSPRGDMLLFVSDRSGTSSLWGIPVRDGAAVGAPQLLLREIGAVVHVFAVTNRGAMYINREIGLADVFVQALDAAGRPTGSARSTGTVDVGGNRWPTFAADGRSITYTSEATKTQMMFYTVLATLSLESGVVRSMITDLAYQAVCPRWSPDGRTLLVAGGKAGRYGYYRVDPNTGRTTPILTVPFSEDRTLSCARWLADSRQFIYQRLARVPERPPALRAFDTETGEDRLVLAMEPGTWLGDAIPSPTDDRLALLIRRGESGTLMLRETNGQIRHLITFSSKEHVLSAAWMPGGDALLFSRVKPGSHQGARAPRQAALWRFDLKTGVSEPLGLEADSMRDLTVSRDGHQLAWTAGGYSYRLMWVLEHFLPS